MSDGSSIYRMVKVFDKRTGESTYDLKMYGQAAVAYIPTDKALDMMKKSVGEYKEWVQTLKEPMFPKVWKKQSKLEPIIGAPMYFSSVKLDAGWFRTAPVTRFHKSYEDVETVLETENSVYVLRREDD